MPQHETLNDLLLINAADLAANRSGVLGIRQRRNRRRRLVLTAGVLVLIGIGFLGGGKMSYSNGGQWFVPELFAVLFFVIAGVVLRNGRLTADAKVRKLTGPVEIIYVRAGRGYTARLRVAGEICTLRQPIWQPRTRWKAALTGGVYDVYVLGNVSPGVVGMELARQ